MARIFETEMQLSPEGNPDNAVSPEKEEYWNKPKSSSNRKYIAIVCLAILIIIAAYFTYSYLSAPKEPEQEKNLTGNGKCDIGENCCDNKEDCKCKEGEYCDIEEKICKPPQCGNLKCEYFEAPDNCPKDCGCYDGDVYIEESGSCEKKEFTLSDKEVRSLITNYFSASGQNVTNIEILNLTSTWKNEVGANTLVFVDGDESFISVLVLQNRTVVNMES